MSASFRSVVRLGLPLWFAMGCVGKPGAPELSVSPAEVQAQAGAAPVELTATVKNSDAEVTWALTGPGSLDASSGTSVHYLPPDTLSSAASAQLVATLVGTEQSATVAIALAPRPASALSKEAGDDQAGTVGALLATDLQVKVTDAVGTPLSGVEVQWTVEGGGSLSAATARTDASGLASTQWTLGTVAGAQTVQASSGSASATFTAQASADVAAQLSAASTLTPTGAVNTATTLSAKVTDVHGNPIAGYAIDWSASAGSLSAASTETGASGVATVEWTFPTDAGPLTATASAAGLSGSPVQFDAHALPGAPVAGSSTLTVADFALVANGTSSTVVTVRLFDGFGNKLASSGGVVQLTTTAGTLSAVTDHADGHYTASLVAPTTVGQAELGATLDGAAIPGSPTVDFVAGPLDHFAVTLPGGAAIPDQELLTSFDVQFVALDATGNRVTSFSGTVDVSGNQTLLSGGGTTPAFTQGMIGARTVRFGSQGLAQITVVRTAGSESGRSNDFHIDAAPAVTSLTPANGATKVAVDAPISVQFSEPVNVSPSAFELGCPGAVAFTLGEVDAWSYTLTPAAPLAEGATCTVRVIAAQVTDADAFDGPDAMATDATSTFTLFRPKATNDAVTDLVGNVSVDSSHGATPLSLFDNDETNASTKVTFYGWNAVSGATEQGGSVTVNASGTFVYAPAAGFRGTDHFVYVLNDTTQATVSLTVGTPIWFVDASAPSSGDGRLGSPFNALSRLASVNDGAAGHPAAGDLLFLYQGNVSYSGGLTLLANQKLVGQDAGAGLAAYYGGTISPYVLPLPAAAASDSVRVTLSGAGGLVLGASNTLAGLNLAYSSGIAIAGSGFGTLTVSELDVATTGAPAVRLMTGAVAGSFHAISSANSSTYGLQLTSVGGLFTVTGDPGGTRTSGGTISGAALDGIYASGVGPLSLQNMSISGSRGNGISGSTVAGLSLTAVDVTNSGDAFGESGLQFSNLTGTVTLTNVNVSGSRTRNAYVSNSGGSLQATVTGSTFRDTSNTADGLDNVVFEQTGGALNVTITGSTFSNSKGVHLALRPMGATFTGKVSSNTFTGGPSAGPQNVYVEMQGPTPQAGSFEIAGNDVSGIRSHAIDVRLYGSSGGDLVRGKIFSNRVSGGIGGAVDCIRLTAETTGSLTANVTNNQLQGCTSNGISTYLTGAGTLNATVTGNSITNLATSAFQGFFAQAGLSPSDTGPGTLCLVLGHPTDPALRNTLSFGPQTTNDYSVRQSGAATLLLPFLSSPTVGAAKLDLDARNNHLSPSTPASGAVSASNSTLLKTSSTACPTAP